MNKIKYIIILISVILLSACSNKKIEVINIEKKREIVLPKKTTSLNLIEFEVIEINKNICVNEENLNKFITNYIELKRYYLELKNENNALRQIINNEVKK